MTPVRESRWLAESPRAPLARTQREFSLETLVAVSFFLAASGAAMPGFVVKVFLLFFAFAGLCLAHVLAQARREERQTSRYAALRAEFEGDERLVSLIVRQGDAPTGEDVGVLWIEAGRLYFSGQRTSFGLVPDEARHVSPIHDRIPRVRNEVDVILRRDTGVGAMALSFAPILPPHESLSVHCAALRTDLRDWVGGYGEGEGQYPPVGWGPTTIGDRRLLLEALAVTLLPSTALALILRTLHAPHGLLAVGFGVFVMVAAVPASNLRWRALRDRRRLRRAG